MSMVLHQLATQSPNGQFSAPPGGGGSCRAYPPATAEYEDLVHSSEVFLDKLRAFHSSCGSKFAFQKVPTVGGKVLDLHQLFVEVTSRGGIQKVTRDRRWKEVIQAFSFPSTITSASFNLRKFYMSFLYHFEQVYFFRKEVPPISMPDSGIESLVNGSANKEDGAYMNNSSDSTLQPGFSVTGSIDGKFDSGYLITVKLGAQELKGVLYHIPPILHMSQSDVPHSTLVPARRSRKRSRLALRDPSRPKSNKSGYNFFFAENYARLRPQYYGQERAITKKIGYLWSNLSDAEKQVYQEKGLRDKERYKSEMLEYQSSKM